MRVRLLCRRALYLVLGVQLRGELGDVHVLEALVQWVGVVEQHLLAQGLVVVARVAVPVSG